MQNSHLYSKNLQHLLSTTIYEIKVHYRGNSDFCEWRAVHAHARKLYTRTLTHNIRYNDICICFVQITEEHCLVMMHYHATTTTTPLLYLAVEAGHHFHRLHCTTILLLSFSLQPPNNRRSRELLLLLLTLAYFYFEIDVWAYIYNHTTAMYVSRCVKIWSSSCKLHTKPPVYFFISKYTEGMGYWRIRRYLILHMFQPQLIACMYMS